MSELADIETALQAMWNDQRCCPTEIYVSWGTLRRFARASMRKRQFRRWQGRMRAMMRKGPWE